MDAERTTGAVYLAGYGVECMLKALVLATTPGRARKQVLETFRGGKAHDFQWLKDLYLRSRGPAIPERLQRHFALLTTWSVSLRYRAANVRREDAVEFLLAANEVIQWAETRM
jgi:hypothetical protein